MEKSKVSEISSDDKMREIDTKMVLRTKDGVSTIYDVVPVVGTSNVNLVPSSGPSKILHTTFACCSPNGVHVFFQTSNRGIVRRCCREDNKVVEDDSGVTWEDSQGVQYMAFSPLGTYFVTFERPSKPDTTTTTTTVPNNVKVWNAQNGGAHIYGMFCKTFSKSSWPYIRWSNNEEFCLALTSAAAKEILIYANNDFQTCLKRVRMNHITEQLITSFSIAPQTAEGVVVFHAFSPEKKGQPSRFVLLRYPDRLGASAEKQLPLAAKSFFQAEEVTVKWSPRGDRAIVLTQTSVDTTGDSYYGSTQLHLFSTDEDPSMNNTSIQVSLEKVGPVSSVEWCPDKTKKVSCFLAISGKMPALAALYNGLTGQPIYIFGEQHRNTISWSPSGRFFCLAGFGNLAGGMDFMDVNKSKKIPQYHPINETTGEVLVTYGNTAPPAGSFGWSPDSRMFHVSTIAPRMNVDNGVRIYKYNGYGPICDYTEQLLPDKLISAEFLPPRLGEPLVDRPQSPPPCRNAKLVESIPAGNANRGTSTTTPGISANSIGTVVQAYVPPSARRAASSGGTTLAERLRKEKESQTIGARKVVPAQYTKPASSSIVTGRTIPGMAPIVSSSNKKKGKPKRPAATKEEITDEQKKNTSVNNQEEEPAVAESSATATDPEKRAKKINKMLKQIEELKARDPSQLNDDQKKKIGSESALQEELAGLSI